MLADLFYDESNAYEMDEIPVLFLKVTIKNATDFVYIMNLLSNTRQFVI